jgi:streptogramin lyase
MNNDQDFDLRVGRWLDAREVPVSAERVSERILSTLATTRQERRPVLRRVPITRPPLRLLAVAAALLIAGGLAAVIGLGSRPAVVFVPPPTSTPDPYPQVVRQIDLGADTWQVLATPTRVWVQTGDLGITGIDPSTGLQAGEVDGGSWMFLEGSDMWVQKGAEQVLVRIDPETGQELERFEGIPGFTVAKDGDTVWGFDENGNVVRVDMATGDELASIDVPEQPKQIVLAAKAVWVACDAGNALVRIDPDTAEVTDTVDVGFGPVELELWLGSLWVRNRQSELVRVDPETADVIATIDGFGVSPSLGLSFGGGYAWASVAGPPGMGAIHPGTNDIAYEIPLPGATYMDSYWLDGTLWVSTAFDQQLLQVDAARP